MNPYIISAISEVIGVHGSHTNPCRQDARCEDEIIDKDALYSERILGGIVDAVQLCNDWSKMHPGKFAVQNKKYRDDWNIECRDVILYVNENLYQKHKDEKLIDLVWQAMYYEHPETLVLNDDMSHADIFKRTASQQRICIAAYVAMRCVESGSFNLSPDDPRYNSIPSLSTLQGVQLDCNNNFIRTYVGEQTGDRCELTVDQFCELPCGSTFLMYGMQPRADVTLELTDEDKFEMMQSFKLQPHWQAEYVALMKMVDTEFQKTHFTRYYTTEHGPMFVKDVYSDAMAEASCVFVTTVSTGHKYVNHHFWRRDLTEAQGSDSAFNRIDRYLHQLWTDYRSQTMLHSFVKYWTSVEEAKNCVDKLQNFTDEQRSTLRSVHHRLFDMYLKTKPALDYERTKKK